MIFINFQNFYNFYLFIFITTRKVDVSGEILKILKV